MHYTGKLRAQVGPTTEIRTSYEIAVQSFQTISSNKLFNKQNTIDTSSFHTICLHIWPLPLQRLPKKKAMQAPHKSDACSFCGSRSSRGRCEEPKLQHIVWRLRSQSSTRTEKRSRSFNNNHLHPNQGYPNHANPDSDLATCHPPNPDLATRHPLLRLLFHSLGAPAMHHPGPGLKRTLLLRLRAPAMVAFFVVVIEISVWPPLLKPQAPPVWMQLRNEAVTVAAHSEGCSWPSEAACSRCAVG